MYLSVYLGLSAYNMYIVHIKSLACALVNKFQLKNLGGIEPPSIRESTPGLAINGGPHRTEGRSTSQRADDQQDDVSSSEKP